jgi:hypothetical protein
MRVPLGLEWGMTPLQVKKKLQGKIRPLRTHQWKPTRGEDMSLEYVGEFDGMATQFMMAYFCKQKLNRFRVVLPWRDNRSLSAKWAGIAERVIDVYGKPARVLFPAGAGKTEEGSALPKSFGSTTEGELRQAIIDGSMFAAIWDFGPSRTIAVAIQDGGQDYWGGQNISVLWEFYDQELMSPCETPKARDF